jgi:hypothetical protein
VAKSWPERQADAADHFWDLARDARELAARLIAEGKARDAQAAVTTAVIATDTASLLNGGVTLRSESRVLTANVAGERVRRLLDSLNSGLPIMSAASTEDR